MELRSRVGPVFFKVNQSQLMGVRKALEDIMAAPAFFANQTVGINCLSGLIAFDQRGNTRVQHHEPAHKQRHVIPCEWAPSASIPRSDLIEMLFNGCFKDDGDKADKVRLIEEIMGAIALGNARELPQQKAFILFGVNISEY